MEKAAYIPFPTKEASNIVYNHVTCYSVNMEDKLEISLKVMNTPSWCLTIYICMKNSRGHNSFKNNSSVTRREYAQLGLVLIILVKLYWILTKGCWEIVFTRNVQTNGPTNKPTDRQAWLLYSPHILCIWGYNNVIRQSISIHESCCRKTNLGIINTHVAKKTA